MPVGAVFEEQLGLGMIASVAQGAGHEVRVVPFNDSGSRGRIAREIAHDSPDVVGLSMQFQHRSHEFLSLARLLRREGFRGHVTAGGQFPTLAFSEGGCRGDGGASAVLRDGGKTIGEVLGKPPRRRTPTTPAWPSLPGPGGLPPNPPRGVCPSTTSHPPSVP